MKKILRKLQLEYHILGIFTLAFISLFLPFFSIGGSPKTYSLIELDYGIYALAIFLVTGAIISCAFLRYKNFKNAFITASIINLVVFIIAVLKIITVNNWYVVSVKVWYSVSFYTYLLSIIWNLILFYFYIFKKEIDFTEITKSGMNKRIVLDKYAAIKALKEIYDSGAFTDDEYKAEKAKIMEWEK